MMKHTLSLSLGLLLLIGSGSLFAQQKLRFGLQFSMFSSKASVGEDSQASVDLQEIYREYEIARLSSALHLFGEYNILPRVHAYLGVGYQNTGHRHQETFGSFSNPVNGNFEEGSVRLRFVVHMVEIPFGVKLFAGKHFYLNVGGSSNVYFSNYTRTTFDFPSTGETTNIFWAKLQEPQSINWTLRPGLGLEFGPDDGFKWFLETYFHHMFQPISRSPRFRRRLSGVGLTTGVKF